MSSPTLAQRAATRALAAEFGPALIWSLEHNDAGTQLIWTDTTPTLAMLVDLDGAISSPLGGDPERWNREADHFDRARVTNAARRTLEAVERAVPVTYI
ncbi:hypothetical protein C8N24_0331 [Solirubrobacter pauli]|uniref:Uncharacterized protein n=1 Tax=Solirubrobacter pauli TaxID=166793 RepID=A0A660L831_9ACTN|nr:hypothetical protein [Solirubrobacter pauli]RKQ90526.1 hypothetical protein C8N24_0331 [Solirubrobacter pauli]